MILYTADLHLFDEAMPYYEQLNNPDGPHWNSAYERDAAIVERWNGKVADDDDVYIVGDVSLAPRDATIGILSQMHGKKHIILGNHDGGWFRSVARRGISEAGIVECIDGICRIRDDGKDVVMCHYPIIAWEKQHRGSYLIYGHLHATKEDAAFQHAGKAFVRNCHMTEFRAMNCGTMVCDYEPKTLNELCMSYNVGGMWSDAIDPSEMELD